MDPRTVEIRTYSYEFRSTPDQHTMLLYLFGRRDELVCVAAFVDRDGPLPGPQESDAGVVTVTYRHADLLPIIDMLRNEKPVTFTWLPEDRVATLTTDEEPVGEEERRRWLDALRP